MGQSCESRLDFAAHLCQGAQSCETLLSRHFCGTTFEGNFENTLLPHFLAAALNEKIGFPGGTDGILPVVRMCE